jgi:hypothetical protein
MYNSSEKTEEANLTQILECAKIVEGCYKRRAANKDDVREALAMLKTAYNIGGVEITFLKVRAASLKQRLDASIKTGKYIM